MFGNFHIDKAKLAYAAFGAAALAALAWAFAPRPVQVETAVVERGRFEQSIEEDGRTRLKDRFTISAPVAARMARITLREGDPVRVGDTIAVLTPVMSSMFDERSLREATARLKAADANVTGAAARVEHARVAQEEARLELLRTEKLAREGFLSASRLDSARLALAGAERELEAANAARQVTVHERAQAAAVLQPAGAAAPGEPLAVRSPVSGVVLRIPLQSEGTIVAGTALMDVGDTDRMEVVAQLLTTDAVLARPGTRAMIERWGGPPARGVVRLVEPAAFTKVSALGIEEQRVNVLIDVLDAPAAWRSMGDGFRVTARVITASADDAVLVPVGALMPIADGGVAVYVLEGGRAKLKPVELGGRNGMVGWVRSGLAPGQVVIVYPPPNVADGKRVEGRRV
ncbi:MAG TPA: HlyD family efflux transporter periplasmic adaptor subunit [Ramlibacter sp.]|uniref:efflux RND transporter periplasmic adaptor subunit n=1 Tax=Ramlibacter sp. TaxID=1917967 RepID=UPI002C90DD37|nr:HlyD family efflux transporter periplasmic adaptor subunit [Ramlibacter sp.]HVZ42862.1 HlyD family efflux transporter periplasmic adaptor subunit [Ramlibacter sp.]